MNPSPFFISFDKRQRYLDSEQLLMVARKHYRVLMVSKS